MKTSKIDLILHPVRMRILMALAGKPMTAGQIAVVLSDVAQATLYRHIKLLAEANVLQVVEEHPMRGTVEKVYALNQREAYLSSAEASSLTRDELLHTFTMFVTSLIGDFERYLQQEEINPAQEISFQKFPIYLSDDELRTVSQTMNQALAPMLKNPPGSGRKRRLITSILIPDADEPDEQNE
jgi:DNA-binding transcriptional ArsR family regulator